MTSPRHDAARRGAATARPGLKLLIPLYVHPAINPVAWQTVRDDAEMISHVIVNAADGPGVLPDGILGDAISECARVGIRLLGYVDGNYGQRPPETLAADTEEWARHYGVTGIFVDQVPADGAGWTASAVCAIRRAGAQRVLGNAGVMPRPATAAPFDGLIVFEGSGSTHARHPWTGYVALPQAVESYHIIHSDSQRNLGKRLRDALEMGVEGVWVTDGRGQNPYQGLPTFYRDLRREVSKTHATPLSQGV